MMNISERRTMNTSDGSESDVRSTISSSSQAERRRMVMRTRGESRRTNFTSKVDKNWDVVESNIIQDQERSHELQRTKPGQDFLNSEMYHENDNGLMRFRREGPSNPVSRPGYDYGNPTYEFDNVGDDRAELLRKMDELQDQLRRSGILIDKGKEKGPYHGLAYQDPHVSGNWYSGASSEMNNRVPMQNPYHDPQNNRPHYPNQYTEPPPSMQMGGDGFYPPRYGPPYRSGPQQAPMPYHMSPSHAYKSGPYVDDGGMMYMDAMDSYPPNFSRHHPSCSCYQCRKKRQVPNHVTSNDRIFNYHDNHSQYDEISPDDYNHRFSDPHPLKSQSYARWPSVVNSEVDGFIRGRPTRAHLPSVGKICRPIAGGAPFFTCNNCFELLLLPEKIRTKNNDKRKKMSCGSCSTVIVFTVSNNNLVVSSDVEPKGIYVNVDKPTSGHGHSNQAKTDFSPEDCDNSGPDLRSSKSTESKKHISTSTYTSEAEEDNESSMSKDEKRHRPLAGSSLQDHFEYSNKYNLANPLVEGNTSGRSGKEEVILNKNGNNKQILRNESLATEIDLSSNEYSNTGTTFDSGEGSRAAKSFLDGIGFNEFYRSNNEDFEDEMANVTVNGHLISVRLIKKAEKLAGPIHPGNYWYDFRAGFWGAIGGPCLGIIPPFIEEFNYPLPEHSAAGNTQVFVNGRELNQKDFNLLVSRGLPKERDRSYIVEISGRVLDEDTGEELESLGKLAPTVERMKHGFGMRAPKAVS